MKTVSEMQSTDKGLLIPRLSTDQMEAIQQPANSLIVFNTTDSAFRYYDELSTQWVPLDYYDSFWITDKENNIFLTKKIYHVGIGTQNPFVKLHIYSIIDEYPNELPVFRLESFDRTKVLRGILATTDKILK